MGSGREAACFRHRGGVEVAGGQVLRAARGEGRALDAAAVEGERTARLREAARRQVERARAVRRASPRPRRRRARVESRGRRRAAPGSRDGAGPQNSASARPISTTLPRYITATRCEMWRTRRRSWATKITVRLQPLLKVEQEVDDLRLHRDVEGRDELVGDQHLRLDGKRAGDADALALAAGELVRDSGRRRRQAGGRARAARRCGRDRRRRGACGGRESASPRIWRTRHARVERAVGVLEDHLDAAVEGAAFGAGAARRCPCPRRRMRPSSGSSSRTRQRASVDLPQPNSPTMPSVSPRRDLERDVVQRMDGRRRAGRARCARPVWPTGKRLAASVDRDERLASCISGLRHRGDLGRGGSRRPAVSSRDGFERAAARLAADGRSRRRSAGERRSRRAGRSGSAACPRSTMSMRALGAGARDRAEQAARVGMARRGEDLGRRCRSRRCARHTSPPCGRRSPRRRRGRG